MSNVLIWNDGYLPRGWWGQVGDHQSVVGSPELAIRDSSSSPVCFKASSSASVTITAGVGVGELNLDAGTIEWFPIDILDSILSIMSVLYLHETKLSLKSSSSAQFHTKEILVLSTLMLMFLMSPYPLNSFSMSLCLQSCPRLPRNILGMMNICWFQLSSVWVALKYDFNMPELTDCGVVTVKINIILQQLLSFLWLELLVRWYCWLLREDK